MQHGQFKIAQLDNYIKVSLFGDFNVEGSAALSAALKHQVNKLTDNKFALLFNLSGFTGATPCAYQEHEWLSQWLLEHGLESKAMVYSNKFLSAIGEQRVPSRRTKNFQVFSREKCAHFWLINLTGN